MGNAHEAPLLQCSIHSPSTPIMIQFSLAHPTNGTAQHFEAETMPTVEMWADMASRTTDPLSGFQGILSFLQQPAFKSSVCRDYSDDDSQPVAEDCTIVALLIDGPAFDNPVYVGNPNLQAYLLAAHQPEDILRLTVYIALSIDGQLSWYSPNFNGMDSTLCIRQTSSDPVQLPAFLTGTIQLSSFFPEVANLYVTPLPFITDRGSHTHTVSIPMPSSDAAGDTGPTQLKLQLRFSQTLLLKSNPFLVEVTFSIDAPHEEANSFRLNWSVYAASLSTLTEALFPLIANAFTAYTQFCLIRDLWAAHATPLTPRENPLCWQLLGSAHYRAAWSNYDIHGNSSPVPFNIRRDGPVNPQTSALRMAIDLPLCVDIELPQNTPRLTLRKAPTIITAMIYFPPPTGIFPAGDAHQLTPEFVSIYNYLEALLYAKTAASLQC